MRHIPPPALEYNVPWPNAKPLLSEQSVFVRSYSRLDFLRAVPYRLLKCPRRMTRRWQARANAGPLRASKARRGLHRRPLLATNERAPALDAVRKRATPLHPRCRPAALTRPVSKASSPTLQPLSRSSGALLVPAIKPADLQLHSIARSMKTAESPVINRALRLLQSISRKVPRWNML